jgi:PAS domain S-box-containing protein
MIPAPERQRSESELEIYKLAIDASSIVGITDAQGIISYVNDNFCHISKYSSSELIGQTHKIVNSGYHSKGFFSDMWSTISSGQIWKGEIRNRAKDGSTYWVDTTIVPFMDESGKPERYMSIRSDITDRKQAKDNKFQMLFDYSLEGLLLARPDGTFLEVNEAFCQMLGYSHDEFLKLTRADITLSDDAGLLTGLWVRAETGYYKGSIKLRRKDGAIIDTEISSAIYKDESGENRSYVCATDVTQKKRSEEALRINEHRLRSMIEHSHDIITLVNADGSMRYRSPSYASIMGYVEGEMEERVVFEQIHLDDLPSLRDLFVKLMSEPGSSFKSQWRQRHKNGSYRWMEGTGTNRLNDPDLNAIVCNFRDITEHIEIEHQLEKANGELNMLFNTIDEVLYSANINPSRLLQMSAACEKIYGYAPSEFFKNGALWFEVILPEDRAVVADITKILETGKQASGQYRIRHKDGRIKWIEASLTPTLGPDAALVRIDGINRDITEKKMAEEAILNSEKRFRTLIENNKEGIALSNKDRQYIYVSPSVKNILGYESEELIGVRAVDLYHPDDQESMRELIVSLMKKGIPYASNLVRVRHKNGEWRWIELTVANQLDDPAVNAIVTNFRDVTERKKAKEELEQLNESLEKKVLERTLQLEESNKALESFSSLAAHDLQSPLRVLSGYTDLLQREYAGSLDEGGTELLNTIMQQTKRMTQLVSDLLTFSRASHTIMIEQRVNLDEMVKELCHDLRLTFGGENTTVTIHKLGCCSCDAGLMRQVWSNLISNALKYSGKKEKPEIEISRMEKNNENLFYVKDNGAGFDMSHAKRLFQIFQRLHSVGEFEGTGLGLALVKNVVNRHGGRVWVEAAVDKGATFFFSLPD